MWDDGAGVAPGRHEGGELTRLSRPLATRPPDQATGTDCLGSGQKAAAVSRDLTVGHSCRNVKSKQTGGHRLVGHGGTLRKTENGYYEKGRSGGEEGRGRTQSSAGA